MTIEEDNRVYYFAFGSNMCESKMQDRLGDRWQAFRTSRGVLHGWRLAFNVAGFPAIGEPSFASIDRCEGKPDGAISPVCGIIYEMDRESFDYLHITEGGGSMYNVVELDVECLCSGRRIKSHAFISAESTTVDESSSFTSEDDSPCSKRYRDILVRGSRQCALPSWYCTMLEKQIPYVDYGVVVNSMCAILVRGLFLYMNARETLLPTISRKAITVSGCEASQAHVKKQRTPR